MKIVGTGNDSTANKTTKNFPVVENSEIYILYIATIFETIIFSASIPLPVYSSQILTKAPHRKQAIPDYMG